MRGRKPYTALMYRTERESGPLPLVSGSICEQAFGIDEDLDLGFVRGSACARRASSALMRDRSRAGEKGRARD